MLKAINVLFFIFCFSFSCVSQASGVDFLNKCKILKSSLETGELPNDHRLLNMGICAGTISGVKDSLQLMEPYTSKEMKVCFPEGGLENKVAYEVVIKYLEENSEKLHMHEVPLITLAFHKNFPCK